MSETTELGQLATMIADLDGYIERRAAELAAPLIEEARARAAEEVASAEHEVQRKDDLLGELRRRIKSLQKEVDRWRDATGVLSADAARPPDDPAVIEAWTGAGPEMLAQAAELVIGHSWMASPGILRRELGISYQHAGEVLDLLHAGGIVGPPQDGWRSREVLGTARSGLQKLRARLLEDTGA